MSKALCSLLLLLTLCATAGCNNIQKSKIASLLDARDRAVSEQSLEDFSVLLTDKYDDHGRSKIDVVAQMINLFEQFEQISMHSHDRIIRIIDEAHAQCEQTYTLKVFADEQWRSLVQKEQLQFERINEQWRISGGL
ncbi:MAG: hypothetical protein CO186_04910 [Zetaproteobacteria bacterium CG_4_9_14_3_um_filter_49_83]|nr:MAG: hypothetical protein AUJ56_00425 [Zetaproteobacteria bacterium CG1_02_49_23]PIQ31543.1 MAG: hypothetical protein COW62_09795 [Zetaproteobacteria bacterium CG17_big_fil_post_rev_8_21_14_2_50_50_13]PIV31095.1 MAG: hypothetical protein COS35_03120 [Zetaproteobacteria bacterium CG02_land_8_20_14_3_00_50_9]PIY54577.1 MAG: hypothetical protein COZ00_13570 [Zetaproteobacteria bacterium CG_4_10_14_0_8_um_filter_49_80]PJA35694.1 MAG: hypothetical protein CO186_04910 [Zetaproteobacteria bacterium